MSSNNWIKTEDQLPEIKKWVLISNGTWVGVGRYDPDESYDPSEPKEDQCLHPDWQDETTEWVEPPPTHWQPLPAPPNTQPLNQ